jgi:hypothetical protein
LELISGDDLLRNVRYLLTGSISGVSGAEFGPICAASLVQMDRQPFPNSPGLRPGYFGKGFLIRSQSGATPSRLGLRTIRFVVVSLNGDLCGSNSRLKMAVADFAAEHNCQAVTCDEGVILIVDVACAAHIVHRIVELTFKLKGLIGNLYATAYCASLTDTPPATDGGYIA